MPHVDHPNVTVGSQKHFDLWVDVMTNVFGGTVFDYPAEGDLLDTITGLKGGKSHVAKVSWDGQATGVEITYYKEPAASGSAKIPVQHIGVNHFAMHVGDIGMDKVVAELKKRDFTFESDPVDTGQGVYCYSNGPDGSRVELVG